MKIGSPSCRASLRATRNMEWVPERGRADIAQARCGADVDDLSGIAEDLYVSCLSLMYTSPHGCCCDGTQSSPRSVDRRCA